MDVPVVFEIGSMASMASMASLRGSCQSSGILRCIGLFQQHP